MWFCQLFTGVIGFREFSLWIIFDVLKTSFEVFISPCWMWFQLEADLVEALLLPVEFSNGVKWSCPLVVTSGEAVVPAPSTVVSTAATTLFDVWLLTCFAIMLRRSSPASLPCLMIYCSSLLKHPDATCWWWSRESFLYHLYLSQRCKTTEWMAEGITTLLIWLCPV